MYVDYYKGLQQDMPGNLTGSVLSTIQIEKLGVYFTFNLEFFGVICTLENVSRLKRLHPVAKGRFC